MARPGLSSRYAAPDPPRRISPAPFRRVHREELVEDRQLPAVVLPVGGGSRAVLVMVHRRGDQPAQGIEAHPDVAWRSIESVLDPAAGKVTTVGLPNVKTGALSDVPVDGLFVAIGHQPDTALFKGQLELYPNEYIKVKPGYWQAVTAAGTGYMAALEAERYLEAQDQGD